MPLAVAIHQPSYLPWAPLFHKMMGCDLWVHLDDVQFRRRSSFCRAMLKGPDGQVMLTVPVVASRDSAILDVRVSDDEFRRKPHFRIIETLYRKAPHFDEYQAALKAIYDRQWVSLCELNTALTDFCREALGIQCAQVQSSELGVTTSSSQRILDICRAVGADTYLSGAGGIRYMDLPSFREAGIDVQFQLPQTPEYPQRHPRSGFVAGLSVIDAMMNLGPGTHQYVEGCGEIVDEATMRGYEEQRLACASGSALEQSALDDELSEPWGP